MAKIKKKPVLAYAPDAHLTSEKNALGTNRYNDVYYEHTTGKVTGVDQHGSLTFVVKSEGKAQLRLSVLSNDVVRIRFSVGAPGRDFSYAVVDQAGTQDAKAALKEQKLAYLITTATLKIEIAKADGQLTISELATDKVLHEFAKAFYGRSTLNRGLEQVRIQLKTNKKEGIYGLGDKAWDHNLQGSTWANWTEDAFAYGESRQTLYRSIPFYYGLKEGTAYGLFLDNSYRSHFDFNSHKDNLTTIWADGGEFDYYFIGGPLLNDVATRYHQLTGTPELPPLWAMGFHQCRWSYYPESRVRELAKSFRSKKIPCDAIYLDIDYMDGYRCFTWNKEHFPDPKKMIGDLKEDGFHTVVMIDPGIRVDENYHVYADGMEEDVFCRRTSGELMVGPVWPPECVWPDYTDPFVRDWWGPLYEELYNEQGVSGFWNDMNEPAVFKVNHLTFPDDVGHDFDGAPTNHKKAHNIYGMQMTRASYDGLKALQPAKRPFLLGRATFSGRQHRQLGTPPYRQPPVPPHGHQRFQHGGYRHRWLCGRPQPGNAHALATAIRFPPPHAHPQHGQQRRRCRRGRSRRGKKGRSTQPPRPGALGPRQSTHQAQSQGHRDAVPATALSVQQFPPPRHNWQARAPQPFLLRPDRR